MFSNHLGKPTFRGRDVPADQARDLVQGLKALGYLDDVDMMLTGYLGTPDTARLAAELAGIIRAQNPKAIFACDPVMGDDDALYVKPDLADTIAAELIQTADVLLPNIFELGRLTGRAVKDAHAAVSGILEPMGGPKGFALSLMVEILSGVITGAAVSHEVASIYENFSRPNGVGHVFMSIDVEAFVPRKAYFDRIETLVGFIQGAEQPSGKARSELLYVGVDEVRVSNHAYGDTDSSEKIRGRG